MGLRGIVCFLAFLGAGRLYALQGSPVPAQPVQTSPQDRFPLAKVDALGLGLGKVRVLPSWDALGPDFSWQVRFQDPRRLVKVDAPDGRGQVWRGRDGRGYWLYYKDEAGRVQRLKDCHNAYQAVWSPDSRQVAYCAMDWPRHLRSLYVLRLRRGGPSTPRLAFAAKGHLGALASWSPDGKKIVFCYYGKLWIMNSDGIGRSLLNLSGRMHHPLGDAERIAWSRDGTRLAWQARGESTVALMELKALKP